MGSRVLVTGAGGKTGKAVCAAAVAAGHTVRVSVHREAALPVLRSCGAAEFVTGDMLDPVAAARSAAGVDVIYHIAPNVSPDEVAMGEIAITAARDAGVAHFVFHSVLLPKIEAMPHHWKKYEVEELLRRSGLAYTILQPTMYMQNIVVGWDAIREEGIYTVPYPSTARMSLVDLADVGEAAARVFGEAAHFGKSYELCAETMTPAEIAEKIGAHLGRGVAVRSTSPAAWRAGMAGSGLGQYQLDALERMFRYYSDHGFAGGTEPLAALLGRSPGTLAAFLGEHMKNIKRDKGR